MPHKAGSVGIIDISSKILPSLPLFYCLPGSAVDRWCSHRQDAAVEPKVRQALARPRVAHALRPSAGSSHRIIGNLRSTKSTIRREERYRIISRSRAELLDAPEPHKPSTEAVEEREKGRKSPAEIQVVDLVHEDGEDQGASPDKVGRPPRPIRRLRYLNFTLVICIRTQSIPNLLFALAQASSLDPEAILCNNTKMLRERLNICGDGLGGQNWDPDSEYVYDLYYQEMVTPGWIQDILSVRAYADEGELVRVRAGIGVWVSPLGSLACCPCPRCPTSWSTKRRCTMMRMMKTMRPTGGTTTPMRRAMATMTERSAMAVSLSLPLQTFF